MKINQRWLWILLFCSVLIGGFALRVWRLEVESIWHDEGWSIRAIYSPFGTPDDNTPYGYYTLLHGLWWLGGGDTPFALRYGSVLLDMLTMAFVLKIAQRWYGQVAGLTAGALVALAPLLWEYAQEVRAYVAVPLFVLIFLTLADTLLKHTQQKIPRQTWIILFIAEFLGIYTHNLVVILVVWLNVGVGVVWLYRRDWPRILNWAFVQALLVASYLPWLSTQSPSGTPLNSTPTLGWQLAVDIWRGYFLPVLPQLQEADNTTLIDGLGFVFIGAIVMLIIRQRTYRTWLLVSHVILVPFLSAVLIITAHIDFHPRYFVASVPLTLLVMVAGISAQVQWRALSSALIVFLSMAIISQNSLSSIADNQAYQHDDFASLAEYYATLPEEAVIIIPFDREPALQTYYARQYAIQAHFLNIPLHSREDVALRYLRPLVKEGTARQVELLTWYQLPADQRGMYPCILTATTSADLLEPHVFYGLSTQAYDFAQRPEFEPIVARPEYRELVFQGMGAMESTQGICVRSNWQVPNAVATDYAVAISVYHPRGAQIAKADAEITTADNVPTSQWEDIEVGTAYNLVRLPAGTPRNDYTLQLRVYDEAHSNGIALLGASVGVQGTDYEFPETMRLAGPLYRAEIEQSILVADNAPEDKVLDGTEDLQVEMIVAGADLQPADRVTVRLYDEVDNFDHRLSVVYSGAPTRAWLSFNIPSLGQGTTYLEADGIVIETYTIAQINRTFELPAFELEVNEKFPGVGNLLGVNLPSEIIEFGDPLSVELVWQANAATPISYTVFVQLLNADGQLLAQSDRIPVSGTRPTTNWAAGEYLLDNHTLDYKVDTYEGDATLIVGLYETNTGTRIQSGNSEDFIQLPVQITVVDNE